MLRSRLLLAFSLLIFSVAPPWTSAVKANEPETVEPSVALPTSAVQWLRPDTLVWVTELSDQELKKLQIQILSSSDARLLQGGAPDSRIAVQLAGRLKPDSELGKAYPWLKNQPLLKIQAPQDLARLLQTQLLLRATQNGQTLATEGIQLAELLDHSLSYEGQLGLEFHTYQPVFRLWAPTARQVQLLVYDKTATKLEQRIPLRRGPQGTWEHQGHSSLYGHYYLYEVEVYSPAAGEMVTNWVTDPYSTSLAANSTHSQVISLKDSVLMPSNWQSFSPPQTEAPEDMVIYELHLRDFSVADTSVPEADRGKYTAFSQTQSKGMRHLKQLADAGLTHVHLLPVFDLATIEEEAQYQARPQLPNNLAPDSDEQQVIIGVTRTQDAYNWGYDPYHYGVPEGSYSRSPHSWQRIVEFRQMVQALGEQDLGLIMDVVYNHTHAWGQQAKSVLDKIVPGYYYRLDNQGQIQQTTCCPDTASEHKMMEKLMIDTLVRWARDYKVSGFRFDLMGHHTTLNLQHLREALDQLTLAQHGIDGKKIYLYGEGWKFGSLDAHLPAQAMTQANAFNLGVGTFNDRLRDSARGGNFDHSTRSDQGWLSGLYLDPNQSSWNSETPLTADAQKALLIDYTNNICLGMAGNLRNFKLRDAKGQLKSGEQFAYRGQSPAAYTADPQESINYVSAHDNYSLWDQIAAKAPYQVSSRQPETATPYQRMEMQMLGLATVLLGQGVPFLDAGIEILRSKSGDGDSYDSGDWFNALDWSYSSNGWGKGLPPAWRNEKEWDFWKPRLSDAHFMAGHQEILAALAQTQRLLSIRKASPLLRLRSEAEILQRVRFLNAEAGLEQIPGLIAMWVNDAALQPDLDPQREGLLVLLNPAPVPVRFSHSLLKEKWRFFQVKGQAVLQQPYRLGEDGPLIPAQKASQAQLAAGQIQLPAHGIVVLEQSK